jgi:hypothetical protein
MDEYTVPPIEVLTDFVKQYDRRIGLRVLYSRYSIPKHEREKYRELWSRFYDALPDAFEKELIEERDDDGSDMHSPSGRDSERTGERDRQESPVRNDQHS